MNTYKLFIITFFLYLCGFAQADQASYEIAINALQIEISRFEMAKESTECLGYGKKQINYATVAMLVSSGLMFACDKFEITRCVLIVGAVYLNMPRFLRMLIENGANNNIKWLRNQIKRLKQEEVCPI